MTSDAIRCDAFKSATLRCVDALVKKIKRNYSRQDYGRQKNVVNSKIRQKKQLKKYVA